MHKIEKSIIYYWLAKYKGGWDLFGFTFSNLINSEIQHISASQSYLRDNGYCIKWDKET